MPFFTGLWRHSREDLMKKECLARSTADEFGGEGRGLVGERGGEDHVAGRKGLFGLLGEAPGLLVLRPAVGAEARRVDPPEVPIRASQRLPDGALGLRIGRLRSRP